jgi:Spy/CpxP family protein refolding chaperone
MYRKIFIFAFALLLSINTFSIAQMRMSHEERVKQYSERLKLNDNQTKVVDSIFTLSEKKMSQITTDDKTQRREVMRKIMDESNKQIESILTPEQDTLFQKMLAERRNRMNGQGQGAH